MDIQEIKENVAFVCKQISDTESLIWHTSEWNICSHIQSKLQEIFSGYNVDVELVKKDKRRPDITIHRRGRHSDNLVAFEVKKGPKTKDIQEDLDKINETFFKDPYFYKFGIFISIGKLPDVLPEFDKSKIGIIEVYDWEIDHNDDNCDIRL